MKEIILIFALVFVLWAWIDLHARRVKEEKRMWKETKEILLNGLKVKESVQR